MTHVLNKLDCKKQQKSNKDEYFNCSNNKKNNTFH